MLNAFSNKRFLCFLCFHCATKVFDNKRLMQKMDIINSNSHPDLGCSYILFILLVSVGSSDAAISI